MAVIMENVLAVLWKIELWKIFHNIKLIKKLINLHNQKLIKIQLLSIMFQSNMLAY